MQRCFCVFLKYPEPGKVKTRLAKDLGAAEAAAVYSRLVCEVLRQVKASSPDLIAIFYDPPDQQAAIREWLHPWLKDFPGELEFHAQCDGELGDRLRGASELLFQENPDRAVLTIGTDCIELETPNLHLAWAELEKNSKNSVVLGPTPDGGYYLLGTAQHHDEIFQDIPWSSQETFAATVQKVEEIGLSYFCLPKKEDIDTVKEYQSFVSQLETQPCLFFDRDGVVNRSPGPGYVLNTKQFHLNDGIVDALKVARDKGYFTVVITSQKGIGKGLMTHADLDEIHSGLQTELASEGVAFDAIYYYSGETDSPHQPKPNPEMILTAAKHLPIDLEKSWMIGDADRDIEMANNANLKGTIRIHGDKPISIDSDFTLESPEHLVKLLKKAL